MMMNILGGKRNSESKNDNDGNSNDLIVISNHSYLFVNIILNFNCGLKLNCIKRLWL